MDSIVVNNPFVVGKYISDEFFCDRQDETEFLKKQIDNGRNIAIISPRRMGKTGLIQHLFNQSYINGHYYTFFVDIYATSSLNEFVYLLGKNIYDKLGPKQNSFKSKFFNIIKSLRVGFKLDALTGEPALDISLGDIEVPERTLDEIFEYLEMADKPCIVAIDEFQQIGEYAEKNIEALLRTKIQQCKKTQFLFSGSKRHTMNNMFNSSSKPFYQSAISFGLEAIPVDVYSDFAVRLFNQRDKDIEPWLVKHIYDLFNGCTWFVQMMMNELFALTPQQGNCTITHIDIAWRNIIQAQEMSYKTLLSQLAPKQKMILQAIAKERIANGITSAEFIKKHKLPSASSVQAAIKPLLKQDIITKEDDGYRVYDYFFAAWLAEEY